MSGDATDRRPLRVPAMLGLVVGLFLAIESAWLLVVVGLLSRLGAASSGSSQSLPPDVFVVGNLGLAALRLKLAGLMFRARSLSRPLCVANALSAAACAFVLLAVTGGTPGPISLCLVGMCTADIGLTLSTMLTESRRRKSEAELERLKAEGRVVP